MKILLALSLIFNFVLLGWILNQPEKAESQLSELEVQDTPYPKSVAEEMDEDPIQDEKIVKAPVSEKETSSPALAPMDFDGYELGVSAEKVEQEKTEYLINTLQINEDVLKKHEKLREEFNRELSKSWGKGDFREPSIEQRRRLLDVEEGYMKTLEKLYGKKNWEKYRKFREEFNSRGFKKQIEDKQPFIFMNL